MKNKLNKILPESEFGRNVLTLLTGSGIAQIIPVLSSLILARLYSPNDFGVLALYISIVTIFGSISALRYEVAIVLPKRDNDAKYLFLISIFFSVILFLLYSILLFCFYSEFSYLIKSKVQDVNWLPIIPIGIIVSVVYQIIAFWMNRKKGYKKMAMARVIQSSSSAISNITLGVLSFGSIGLIFGSILGQVMSSFFLFLPVKKDINFNYFKKNKKKIVFVANKYKQFPFFSTPSTLFNSISNVGLPILITIFYGAKIAGLYFFGYRIIRLPFDFMFSSFSQVYREHAVGLYNKEKQDLLDFTRRTQKKIVFFMLPSLIVLSIVAPFLFQFFFGEQWRNAGEYVAYFSIFIFFNGIYSPVSSIGDVLMKQKAILVFNVIVSIVQVLVLYFMSSNFSFKTTILVISIICGLLYLALDYYMKSKLKQEIQDENKRVN